MQLFTGVVVWLSLVGVIAFSAGSSAYLWYLWWEFKNGRSTELLGFDPLESVETNSKTLLALAIILSTISLVFFLIIVASRKRIALAIQVIKEASKAVQALPALIFLPVLKYISLIILFAWGIFMFAIMATSGKSIASAFDSATQEYVGDNFSPDQIYYFLIIYVVFGMYWSWNFIIGCGQCSIAGSVATWYWCRDKSKIPLFTVGNAVYRTLRYHAGSIAFGAMLVAIIQTIQFIMMQVQRRLKEANNKIAQLILATLQCIFCCLEKLLHLLNKNAYIEIAVYGYSYCEASRNAFQLIMRNSLRLLAIDGIGSFILFAGKLAITSGVTILGAYLLRRENQLVTMYAVPLIIIFVAAWVISTCFVAVTDMAIDTIFICFCEDCEHNDGSDEKPYYMPDSLKKYVSAKSANNVPDIAQPQKTATIKD